MGLYYSHVTGRAGIQHYWKLDGDGTDSIGSADLTLSGGRVQVASIVPSEPGGTCEEYHGSGYGQGTITVGDTFVVMFWYISDENADAVLFSLEPTNSIVTIAIEGGLLKVRVNTLGSTIETAAPVAATLHHVAVMVTSTGHTHLWVDGDPVDDVDAAHYTNGTYTLDIGRYGDFGGGYYFVGKLDEIAVLNQEIDDSFVFDSYGYGVTPPESDLPLVAGSLSSTAHTSTTITLEWTDGSDGTGTIYPQLQRSPSGAGTWSNVAGAIASPFTDTGLASATAFDYRVAYTDEITTEYSNTVTVTTDTIATTGLQLHLRMDEPNTTSAGQFAHQYLALPGRSGYYASAADSTALSVTGDVEFIIYAAATDWTPGTSGYLWSKALNSGQLMWDLLLNTDGTLRLRVSKDGSALTTFTSTAATGITDGTAAYLKVTLDVDDGGGNRVVAFYKSTDGATYTQIGSNVTSATAGNTFDGTDAFSIGAQPGGTTPFAGRVYRMIVKSGIGGTVVFDADFTAQPTGTVTFLESSSNAATVTVNGPVAADSSGNLRDGSAINGVVFGSVGRLNKAATFDRVNDYVRVTHWASMSSWTVMAWANLSSITGSNQIIVAKSSGSGTGGFTLYFSTTGAPAITAYSAGSSVTVSGSVVSVSTWYHLTATFDGTTVRLYVNGVSVGTPTTLTYADNVLDVLVGARNPTTPEQFYGGLIDDVRIYNTALSASEISQVMSSNVSLIKPNSFF